MAHVDQDARLRIHRWLVARRKLLVDLVRMTRRGEVCGHLDRFRTDLMDYLSAGHFGIYELLAEGFEQSPRLHRLHARIERTTEFALRFDERVGTLATPALQRELLASLMLVLEERFEFEDVLIQAHMSSALAAPRPV